MKFLKKDKRPLIPDYIEVQNYGILSIIMCKHSSRVEEC